MENKQKILIIQTAFIGDVILASSLIEATRAKFPLAQIDFLLRKGNESIISTNPNITNLFIWNKSQGKFKSLIKLLFQVRREKYDLVLNIQRFFNSGLLTAFSKGKVKIGFHSNPLSFLFTKKVKHKIPYPILDRDKRTHKNFHFYHEVERNFMLLQAAFPNFSMPERNELQPKIYFNEKDHLALDTLDLINDKPYYVIAPSSVWYTKQWHISKWKELVELLSHKAKVYLIGAPSDDAYVTDLIINKNVLNLCGKLSLRQSALLMKKAERVFVNDSAPLHLASSVNAKTTAVFCSTSPDFGYTPLSSNAVTIYRTPQLKCMPCGLHGHKDCPLKHFKCAMEIDSKKVFETINK